MLAQVATEVSNLILPVSCVSCDMPDTLWCGGCRATPRRVHQPQLAWRHALWGLPVWALTDYAGPWRRAIVAWKDRGVHRLSREFAPHLADLIGDISGRCATVLVPVPSSWSGWVRRGVEPARELARHSADDLARRGRDVLMVPGLLRPRWPSRESLSSGYRRKARSRAQRLSNPPHFRARPTLRGHRVVLVDDVVTTGATLERSAAALQGVGARLVGAVVLAAAST